MGVNNIRVSFSIVCLLFHLHCHLPLCTILREEKWHNPFFSSPSLWKQVNFIPIFITSHVESNPHPSRSKLTPSPYSSPAFWKLINFRSSGAEVHMIVSFQHILFIFIIIIPKIINFQPFARFLSLKPSLCKKTEFEHSVSLFLLRRHPPLRTNLWEAKWHHHFLHLHPSGSKFTSSPYS